MRKAVMENVASEQDGQANERSVMDLASQLYPSSVEQATSEPVSNSTGVVDLVANVDSATQNGSASTDVQQGPTSETKPDQADELRKQLDGQSKASARLGRELKEQGEQLKQALQTIQTLQAKLDGTYEEPQAPTESEIAERENFRGRETSSRAIAEQMYGAEAVQAAVYSGKDSAINVMAQDQPWILNRIFAAPLPAVEAMRIIQEREFIGKYGSNPSDWRAKLIAEIEPELKAKHLDEFKKQVKTLPTGNAAPTVTDTRTNGTRSSGQSLADRFYGVK